MGLVYTRIILVDMGPVHTIGKKADVCSIYTKGKKSLDQSSLHQSNDV